MTDDGEKIGNRVQGYDVVNKIEKTDEDECETDDAERFNCNVCGKQYSSIFYYKVISLKIARLSLKYLPLEFATSYTATFDHASEETDC